MRDIYTYIYISTNYDYDYTILLVYVICNYNWESKDGVNDRYIHMWELFFKINWNLGKGREAEWKGYKRAREESDK